MADGSVNIDVKLNDSKAKSQSKKTGADISKGIESGMKSASNAAKNTESQIKSAMSGAASSSKSSFADVESSSKNSFAGVSDSAKSASSDAKESISGISDAAKDTSNDVDQTFTQAFPAATAVAVAAAAAVVTAVAAIATQAVQVGMEFDKSMSQVAATMGVAVSEIGELRDFAKEMGAATAFSATQASEALNYMALAGYDAQTSMRVLPTVLNLAAAGNMELAAASDMVTDAQSALGLSVEQAEVMVDQMAKTSSKTNTSVSQLGNAFLTVGGTAKNLSGGTAELAQMLGILADNGIKGSEGGTALRNVILSLSAPTDTAAAKIKELGLNVFDAEGNMRSMPEIMKDLNAAMEPLTQQQKTEALNTIFNKVDLKSVNALLGTSADRFDEVAAAIENAQGAAAEMAETQLDNLAGDLTLLQSAAEGLEIQISDLLTPALRGMAQLATNVIMPALSGIVSNFGAVAAGIVAFVATMVIYNRTVKLMNTHTVQAGGYVNVLGKQVKLTGTAFKVATTASKAFSAALNSLKAAAPALAVMLAVEAIFALADAFEKAKKEQETYAKATDGLVAAFDSLDDAATDTQNKLNSVDTKKAQRSFAELKQSIDDNISAQAELADKISEAWTDINGNEKLLTTYISTIENLTNKVRESGGEYKLTREEQEQYKLSAAGINEITGSNIEVLNAENAELSTSVEELKKSTEQWIENAKAKALQEEMVELQRQQIKNENDLADAASAYEKAQRDVNASIDAGVPPTQAQNQALADAETAYNKATGAVDSNTAAQERLVQKMNGTDEAMKGQADIIAAYLRTRTDWKDALGSMGVDTDKFAAKLSELGFNTTQLANLSTDGLKAMAGAYEGSAADIIAICDQLGIEVPEKLRQVAEDGGEATAEGIENTTPQVEDAAENAADAAQDGYASGDSAGTGASETSEFSGGVASGAGGAEAAAEEVSDATQSGFESNNDEAPTWGQHLAEAFGRGISGAIDFVKGAASGIANAVAGILGHSVPKEGILREGGEGEARWGRHLVQNIARGMLGAKSEIENAADEIADTIDDSLNPDNFASAWDSVIDTGEGIARGLVLGYDRVDPAGQIVASMGAMMAMAASNTSNTTNNTTNWYLEKSIATPDELFRAQRMQELYGGLAGRYGR